MLDFSYLNESQRKAVDFMEGPCLVIAAAGTGKTTVLINRVANLIDKGVNEENILLLTFTNKAANEMKKRACIMLKRDELKLTACTYHSFCVSYLRRYAALLGISNNFTIIDSADSSEIMKILKEEKGYTELENFPNPKTLAGIFSISVNKELSIQDILEIEYPNYLKFKDKILELKEDYKKYKLDKNIVDYDDILVFFLKLLSKNENICKDISDVYEYIMVDEYQDSNSLQFKILQELRKFENKNLMVVGDDQQCLPENTKIHTLDGLKYIKNITKNDELIVSGGKGLTFGICPESINKKEYHGFLYKIRTKLGKSLSATGEHIIFARDVDKKNIDINVIKLTMFGSEEFGQHQRFDGYKHELTSIISENGKTSYSFRRDINPDNLNIYSEKILSKDNSKILVKEALLNDYKYDFVPFSELKIGMHVSIYNNGLVEDDVIVSINRQKYDGFVYDLNVPFYRNYLAEDIFVHNCIYGFRGSKFDNIMHFPEQFKNSEIIVLNENYRSNQEILDIANVLIDKAKEKYPKILESNKYVKRKPILLEAYNKEEEANYIIDEMEKFLCPPYNFKMNDIAVLIRGSRDSYLLESMLTKKYYTYEKFGGIKFLERTFVKDIFAFLKLSLNDKDELSWFRIFQLYPNIGIVYAKKMTEKIAENGMDELLKLEYKGKRYSGYFSEIHGVIEHLKTLDLDMQLTYLIDTYYFDLLEKSLDCSRKSKNKKAEELKEIKENKDESSVLYEFANGYTSTLKFLTDLTLETPEKNKAEDRFTISTIHSAKGLEFKVVFVINCVEGSFPSKSNIIPSSKKAIDRIESDLEEERRIFYVAVTRAKDFLYLTYPKTVFTYDKRLEKTKLSQFIDKDFQKKVDFKIKERESWYW